MRTPDAGTPFLVYKFGTVFTTKVSWESGEDSPTEKITFVYGLCKSNTRLRIRTAAKVDPPKYRAGAKSLTRPCEVGFGTPLCTVVCFRPKPEWLHAASPSSAVPGPSTAPALAAHFDWSLTGPSPRPPPSAWTPTSWSATRRRIGMTERAGFQREGIARAWDLHHDGVPVDCVVYSRIRGDDEGHGSLADAAR